MHQGSDKDQPTRLDHRRFGRRFYELFKSIPGPIGLIWTTSTLVTIAIWAYLAIQGGQWLTNDELPNVPLIIASLLMLWLLDALRHGLYRPMRKMALEDEGPTSLSDTFIDAASRIPAVMKAQTAVTALLVFVVFFTAWLVPEFIIYPFYFASFVLGPVVYFVASQKTGVFAAVSRSITVARRHVLYILGIPALFVCLGPLVDSSSILDFIGNLTQSSDLIEWWKAISIFIVYRYSRWISISAAYVAVDEVEG